MKKRLEKMNAESTSRKMRHSFITNKWNDLSKRWNDEENAWKKAAIVIGALLVITSLGWYSASSGGEYIPPTPVVKHCLAVFVINTRGVSLDPVVMRDKLNTAYSFVTSNGNKDLNEMIKDKWSEQRTVKSGIAVQVKIDRIEKKKNELYIVSWTETTFQNLKIIKSEQFQGIFGLKFQPAAPDKNLPFLVNPFGIYVSKITFKRIPADSTDVTNS